MTRRHDPGAPAASGRSRFGRRKGAARSGARRGSPLSAASLAPAAGREGLPARTPAAPARGGCSAQPPERLKPEGDGGALPFTASLGFIIAFPSGGELREVVRCGERTERLPRGGVMSVVTCCSSPGARAPLSTGGAGGAAGHPRCSAAQRRWLRHSRWLRAARCPPAGQVRGDGRRSGLGAAPQAGAVHYTTAPGERGRVPTGSGRPSLGPVGFRFHIAAVPGVLQLNSELLLFNVNPSEASCAAGAGGGLRSGAGAGRGVGAQSLALLPWNLLINDRYRYIYIYI